jgi:peptide/nickel transport system permease protein
MTDYFLRRLVSMVFSFFLLSVIIFTIIQLPPGDFVSRYVTSLQRQGGVVDQSEIDTLRQNYGLDRSLPEQYIRWFSRFLQGDMGQSFEWRRPVVELLQERLPFTLLVSISSLIFTYVIAIPIGIYVATHQYSVGDYAFSIVGLVGLATPSFMLALILMFMFYKYFGISVGGLFSSEYALAPWSLAKVWDLFQHLWIPVIVIGTASTAGLIRVMRGSLLDELSKQYVTTARAKGLAESRVLFKYPVRIALNPILSTIGWELPRIISGETITSIVLNLPTTGPIIFRALLSQDMYLAGATVMVLGALTLLGTLLSDLLLMIVDPRIRFERKA